MRPVVWSIDAQQENLGILRHIAEDNPVAAKRVVDTIEDAGNRLGEFATGRPGRVSGTYEKSLAPYPYVIAYELRQIAGRECVVIVHIIHTSRDWPAESWPQK